jgi:sulfur carrier protein
MHITVNGIATAVRATTLAQALEELDYHQAIVATAVNSRFVAASHRDAIALADGDALEILAPMQGG